MKLKLQFIIAAFIALVVYIPVAHGQARLTFSGGSGAQLSTTLQTAVTYTIINDGCLQSFESPYFTLQATGNFLSGNLAMVTGTINFSINNRFPQSIRIEQSGFTVNDTLLYGSLPGGVSLDDTVVLSAGTITTQGGIAAAKPADGSFSTFITNSTGDRCSSNGVSAPLPPTAATVSVSGRVTTSSGRGIIGVRLSLTDSQGNVRTATTTSFGYYRFDNIEAGETVTITAKARRFKFVQSSIVRTTNESITNADFVSEQ